MSCATSTASSARCSASRFSSVRVSMSSGCLLFFQRMDLLAQVLERRGDNGNEQGFAQATLCGMSYQVALGAGVQRRRLGCPQAQLGRQGAGAQDVQDQRILLAIGQG